MDVQEKMLARKLFQNKILKSDGQSFEDIFIEVMNYSEKYFQAIKPWGNIGDRKNDGYIKNKGIFYQVYAPEDIRKSYVEAVKKLKTDFHGLKRQWTPINEFYFVINDKYKGVNADCEKAIQYIKEEHGLINAGIMTAKDIENILFSLSDDQILSVSGQIPDPASIRYIDFSVLNEVISYIMKLPLNKNSSFNLVLPDWDEKIKFNNLSEPVARLLDNGYFQVYFLEKYLSNNGNFLADALRDQINEVYSQNKDIYSGDDLFWSVVDSLCPRDEQYYRITVIVIMAKYFETCDIFEDPLKEGII